MPVVPAICRNCGAVFSSGIFAENARNIPSWGTQPVLAHGAEVWVRSPRDPLKPPTRMSAYQANRGTVVFMATLCPQEASAKALRALELYDNAMATGTEHAMNSYLGCLHHEVEVTVAYGGINVAASGHREVRAAIENLLAMGVSFASRDVKVVREEPGRVVARYARLLSQDAMPLIAVKVENEIGFDGGLIRKMTIREPDRPADAPLTWAPLGSTPSFAGEIVARWSEEKMMVRLHDGRTAELPTPAEAEGLWDVSDPVIVFFDGRAPLGWYLPEAQFGVDLRGRDDG